MLPAKRLAGSQQTAELEASELTEPKGIRGHLLPHLRHTPKSPGNAVHRSNLRSEGGTSRRIARRPHGHPESFRSVFVEARRVPEWPPAEVTAGTGERAVDQPFPHAADVDVRVVQSGEHDRPSEVDHLAVTPARDDARQQRGNQGRHYGAKERSRESLPAGRGGEGAGGRGRGKSDLYESLDRAHGERRRSDAPLERPESPQSGGAQQPRGCTRQGRARASA